MAFNKKQSFLDKFKRLSSLIIISNSVTEIEREVHASVLSNAIAVSWFSYLIQCCLPLDRLNVFALNAEPIY